MLFLSQHEIDQWKKWGEEILATKSSPDNFNYDMRPNLIPVFHFFAGTLLSSKGDEDIGADWIRAGALFEEDGLFLNAFLSSFLERHENKLILPAVIFADPAPFVHFSTVPALKEAREKFVVQCAHSLPVFKEPFRIMDIGCGNGALTVSLLKKLQEAGRVGEIDEILLIDASKGMCDLAKETVEKDFPDVKISLIHSKIQDCSEKIEGKYDLAISSLAYHHMPFETKLVHLKKLKEKMDHFIIFELDTNNDTPEIHTPELAMTVYQSYGRLIDFVFSHDAPMKLAIDCVDSFLMAEAVSFLIHPRGERTDYHMLNSQWEDLCNQAFEDEFTLGCNSLAHTDEYLNIFTMHYGRKKSEAGN